MKIIFSVEETMDLIDSTMTTVRKVFRKRVDAEKYIDSLSNVAIENPRPDLTDSELLDLYVELGEKGSDYQKEFSEFEEYYEYKYYGNNMSYSINEVELW